MQNFLTTPFQLNGNIRQDETKAHKALREAFVNFCVHALYQGDTKLIILKYPTEIIFSNPGTLLVSQEQYYSGGYSICRNPSLQTMFMFIGMAEKAGSGSDTIIQGWKEANFRLPMISEKGNPNRVELVLPLESILSPDIKQRLVALFGESVNTLDANQLKTLAMTIAMGHLTNSILQHSLELHRTDITSLLQGLCKEGFLISSGIGRGTSYSVNSSFLNSGSAIPHSELTINSKSNSKSDSKSNSKSDSKSNSKSDSKRRIPYSELSRRIALYCSTWKSTREIAMHLCYNASYLSSRIIPRMISDGYMEAFDKESPKNSNQKYRVIGKSKNI